MSTASLYYESEEIPRTARRVARFLSAMPELSISCCGDTSRHEVEDYISDQFMSAHNAKINYFMPLLFTVRCKGGISAVAGIRTGGAQPFFLEQYLSAPVETLVSEVAGNHIPRHKIGEIGNMAATQKGSTQLLLLILCALLQHSRHEWVVFTATPTVLKGIKQLGFQFHNLGAATPTALSVDNEENWGSYYDSRPQVIAGNVGKAMQHIVERKIYSGIIFLFQKQINELASLIKRTGY